MPDKILGLGVKARIDKWKTDKDDQVLTLSSTSSMSKIYVYGNHKIRELRDFLNEYLKDK